MWTNEIQWKLICIRIYHSVWHLNGHIGLHAKALYPVTLNNESIWDSLKRDKKKFKFTNKYILSIVLILYILHKSPSLDAHDQTILTLLAMIVMCIQRKLGFIKLWKRPFVKCFNRRIFSSLIMRNIWIHANLLELF